MSEKTTAKERIYQWYRQSEYTAKPEDAYVVFKLLQAAKNSCIRKALHANRTDTQITAEAEHTQSLQEKDV